MYNMQNIYAFIMILSAYKSLIGSCQLRSTIEPVIVKIIGDFKFYQIIIFTDETPSNDNMDQHFLFDVFISRVPSININLANIHELKNNQLAALPSSQNPRETSFIVMIFSDDSNKSIYSKVEQLMLYFLTNLSRRPRSPRPYCLLIYFNNKNVVQSNLNDILRYAWSNKFLEFTILEIKLDDASTIMFYNPFTNTYTRQNTTHLNMEKLFPDKLKNVHQYPLSTVAADYPPYFTVVRDSQGKALYIEGIYDIITNIFIESLNFSRTFIEVSRRPHKIRGKYLIKPKMGISPSALTAHYIRSNPNMVMSKHMTIVEYVLIVPVLKFNEPHYVPQLSFFILSAAGVQFILTIAVWMFNLDVKIWNIFNIIRIIFGAPLSKLPDAMIKRIILIVLILTSMIFSTNLYANLTESNVVTYHKTFDTYEDIYKSNFSIYVETVCYTQLIDSDNKYIVNLIPRLKIQENFLECLYNLKKYKDRICVMTNENIVFCHDYFKNEDGTDDMKVSKLQLITDILAYGFEEGAPWLIKFNNILQMIKETGIWTDKNRNSKKYELKTNFKSEAIDSKNINVFSNQFGFIILLGYSLSISLFIVEVLFQKCHVWLRKFIRTYFNTSRSV